MSSLPISVLLWVCQDCMAAHWRFQIYPQNNPASASLCTVLWCVWLEPTSALLYRILLRGFCCLVIPAPQRFVHVRAWFESYFCCFSFFFCTTSRQSTTPGRFWLVCFGFIISSVIQFLFLFLFSYHEVHPRHYPAPCSYSSLCCILSLLSCCTSDHFILTVVLHLFVIVCIPPFGTRERVLSWNCYV